MLAIAKKYHTDAEQAFKIYPASNEALDKLFAEEQKAKRAECERKLKDIGSDTIRQVEAVLGGRRWAARQKKGRRRNGILACRAIDVARRGDASQIKRHARTASELREPAERSRQPA